MLQFQIYFGMHEIPEITEQILEKFGWIATYIYIFYDFLSKYSRLW